MLALNHQADLQLPRLPHGMFALPHNMVRPLNRLAEIAELHRRVILNPAKRFIDTLTLALQDFRQSRQRLGLRVKPLAERTINLDPLGPAYTPQPINSRVNLRNRRTHGNQSATSTSSISRSNVASHVFVM